MFKFFKDGKEILPPQKIKWYFESRQGIFFESRPEKLDINARFWQRKLNLTDEEATIVIMPGEGIDIVGKDYKEQENGTTNTATNHIDSEPSNDGTPEQPSVPEVVENSIDTPKRKRRKKATELSDLPAELDNTDSAATE